MSFRSRRSFALPERGGNRMPGFSASPALQSGTTANGISSFVRRATIYLRSTPRAQAIAIVTNGTPQARNPAIWGDGTTARASDSKHFGAWDQNLTTRWRMRYGGRGVMIYWHVERNSPCIHSQLKSPSSSKVASMIEGVVHHCTEMEVDLPFCCPARQWKPAAPTTVTKGKRAIDATCTASRPQIPAPTP